MECTTRYASLVLSCAAMVSQTDTRTYLKATKARIGNTIVAAGDSIDHVRTVGVPDRVVSIKNALGVQIAQEWHYDRGRHVIAVRLDHNDFVEYVADGID